MVHKQQFQDKYTQLGLNIAYYRRLRGLTQEQLAELVDINPAFLSHVEAPNVNKTVSLGTLFAIAKALNIPEYKFFMFDEI